MDNSQIEQFIILAKNQKQQALEQIIDKVLSHPSIYVFSEFMQLPNVQEVSSLSLTPYRIFLYPFCRIVEKTKF